MSWEVHYRRRYRKGHVIWRGEVIAVYGDVIDRFMEESPPPRVVAVVFALTERGIRRRLARNMARRYFGPREWVVRGHRLSAAEKGET